MASFTKHTHGWMVNAGLSGQNLVGRHCFVPLFRIQGHSELTLYVKKIPDVQKKFLCYVNGSTVFGEARQCTPCGWTFSTIKSNCQNVATEERVFLVKTYYETKNIVTVPVLPGFGTKKTVFSSAKSRISLKKSRISYKTGRLKFFQKFRQVFSKFFLLIVNT